MADALLRSAKAKGVTQHMRGDQPIQSLLAGRLADGALQHIMQQADLCLDQP